MRFKNIKFYCLLLLMLFMVSFMDVAHAADKHGLSYRAIKCPISTYKEAGNTGDDLYYSCILDYLEGNLDTYMVGSGDSIDPGTVVLLIIDYTLGATSEVVALNTYINYNSNYWTPIYDSTGILFSYYESSYFPTPNKLKPTGWVTEMNVKTPGTISVLSSDITNYIALKSDIELGYVFLQLNDTVSAGQSVTLSFGTEGAKMSDSAVPANSLEYTTTDMTLRVYGSESQDASLKTLTVSNGSTYYTLDPIFAPGDVTNSTYTTVVPNNITSVDIDATVNNEYATVLSGGLGSKDLQVGENTFTVTVSSQFGNTQTYQVHVYRLSNDISLSNLTLSNGITLGQTDEYTYVANIPYKISNTTISATPTHENAFVEVDNTYWELTNYGANLNTKNVVVKAENCLDKYASVEGNTCSSQTYTIKIEREEPSNNNYLSSLTVDGTSVPNFDKTNTTYTLDDVVTTKAEMSIGAVVEDTGKATIVSETGKVSLNIGDNTFDIVVRAEDGQEKTYTINVRRLSDNINLSGLTVTSNPQGTLSPTFSSSFYGTYTYTYDSTVTSVTITATVEDTDKATIALADISTDSTATGVSKQNTTTETYSVDTTKVAVTVTAEDGNVGIYYINLTRAKSSNNYLSGLSLTEKVSGNSVTLSPTFNSTTFTYTATVDGSIENVDVVATPAVSYAKVVSITGNTDLDFGLNTIEVTVEAENGDQTSYIINLTREKYDIATLDDLKVDGVTVNGFKSDTFEYTLDNVEFEKDSIEIEVTKTNEYATVEGDGTVNLNTGDNTIVVKVTAQNGIDYEEYKINIYREKNSDNTVHGLTVAGVEPTLNADGTYSVTLPNSKDTLNSSDVVITASDDATITQDDSITLSTKNVNQYNFSIKAENGDEEDYIIYITRTKSSDTTVTRVTAVVDTSSYYCLMDGGTSCTITLPALTTSFELNTIFADEATISPVNGTSYNITSSSMSIPLTVTAEDGTIGNYNVNIVRQKSSNNYLSSLSLTEKISGNNVTLSPTFNSTTFKYTATVDGSVENVDVAATTEVSYAEVTSVTGNTDLDFSANTIEVVVQAEDGTKVSYFITLTRKEYDIATLDDLKVDGETINGFKSDTFEYTLDNVEFEKDSIEIEVTKTNEYATVVGDGTVKLSTGDNEIKVTVAAQNGIDYEQYVINIYREKNSDNTVHSLTVAGVVPTLNADGTYSVTLPNSKDTLNKSDVSVTTSDDATVVLGDSISLSTKTTNTYQFSVTSEDGVTKVYSVLITREPSNDSSISKVTLTIGTDSSRYCIMDSNNSCKIEVPVDTLNFSLSADIHDEATISPVNGTSYPMPASESTKSIQLTVTAEDNTNTVYTVNVERQKSSNNNLSDLKVDGVTVTGFDPSKQTYELTVDGDIDKVNVSATVEDTDKATIITDLSNPFPLDFDVRNQIEVTVQAEDTTTKTYTIYITRSHRQDITLKNLTINGIQIDGFTSTKDDYTLSDLPYNTHQLNIEATPNDDNATKTGDGLIRVNTGSNDITITVIAHDTTVTHDYVIHVNRELNNDTSIKGITLAGNQATYNSTTKKYEVTVPNDVDEANSSNLTVEVNDPITTLDKKATYTVPTTQLLTTQTNEITITVTAEDGTIGTHTLVVTREKSDVATLSSLTVTNGSFNPSFNSDTFEYEVTVPVDTTDFNVSGVVTESHANITSGVGYYTMDQSTKYIEVVVVSEDLSKTNIYKLNVVRTKSSDNTLSNITVSEGTLNPVFSSETTSYTVNVAGNIDSIDIGATLNDGRATIVSGPGTYSLSVGDNPVTIHVQSESGASLYYNINVVRAQKEDNNLLDLTVDGNIVPGFDKDITSYTLSDVEYSKTTIDIGATISDSDATVSGLGLKTLKTGLNTFDVVVTAQNGTIKTYTINITREKNDNAYLNILSISGYVLTPNFDSGVFDYEVTVDSTKETLSPNDVTAVAKDSNATISKQGEITLSTTQDNYYKVTVTAEDGVTTQDYTIKVIRPKSSDTSLASVNVTGATISPTFDSGKYNYTVTIPYGSDSFTIDGIANDSKTIVFGNGQYKLSDGVVTLTTQAEDGSTAIYNFYIVEALSNDATLSDLSVSGYPLDKTFKSTELSYSIGNIPYGTTQLKVNTSANNASATIEYYVGGEKQDSNIVNIPEEMETKKITVKVIAADGITTKSYTIDYTLVPSSNAYLSSLVPSEGTIDFLKTTTYYELTVDNDVTTISFDIIAEDSNATVTFNGEVFFTPKTITITDLVVGNNNVSILVTAQDGTTKKTYDVLVKRLESVASSDANLSSLSIENYTLDKSFDMNNLEYSIGNIPFALTELTINATPNVGTSSINYLVNGVKQSGNKVSLPKTEGTSAIVVQVVAEDGKTIKNYKITYEKVAGTNAYLSNIIVSSGKLQFDKNTFEYTIDVDSNTNSIDVTAITEDRTSVMQMNKVTYTSPHTLTLSPLSNGVNEVVIVVTAENGNVLTYKVKINKQSDISAIITSEEYGHTIVNGYIKTVKLATTGIELKNQLDNPNEYLEIWTSDESTKVEDTDSLATGMIVKLMINGEEKDRKVVVIKGDTSGDGEIDLFDAVKILNHYLVKTPLTEAYLEAAYVNDDADIDLFDSVMILNHYLGKISLH